MYDYIIVGSGPTGAQAAQTLVEAGLKVLMMDAGIKDETYRDLIPKKDFITLREQDEKQHEYFLGKNFEGIPWGKIKVGSQLTPPRKFLVQHVDRLLPFHSESFSPMESLAYGGLGSGWGTGCHVFSNADLDEIGLNKNDIHQAYEVVAKRIGISGEKDDANPYCLGNIQSHQGALELEENGKNFLSNYTRKKSELNSKGFYAGKLALAVLSEDKEDRKKAAYDDMNFWSDAGESAYRPWITVEALKKKGMEYKGSSLLLSYEEKDGTVTVRFLNLETQTEETDSCKKLILACGTLGTARIILRSNKSERTLPILSNPYCYMPCLQVSMLGKAAMGKRAGFGQIGLFYDPQKTNFDTGMGALFSYRALLLFKLIKESPLNYSDGRILMQYLQSSFLIAGIHHPERAGKNKFIQLINDANTISGDRLHARYELSESERSLIQMREKKYKWALKKLGCIPLKTIYPGNGASIHYGGTLPFTNAKEEAFSLSPTGKLLNAKNIFVADGSGFRYLPAKGLTLTLMANAHCVAKNSLQAND